MHSAAHLFLTQILVISAFKNTYVILRESSNIPRIYFRILIGVGKNVCEIFYFISSCYAKGSIQYDTSNQTNARHEHTISYTNPYQKLVIFTTSQNHQIEQVA